MNEKDERDVPLGPHLIHIEGDTLIVTVRGTMVGDDMRKLLDHFARIKRECGALFILYDGRQCTSVDADARRVASHGRTTDGDADLRVAFGVPFTLRIILNMIIRAQKILANREIAVHIFEHEKEAYDFLEKERARIRQAKGIKTSL